MTQKLFPSFYSNEKLHRMLSGSVAGKRLCHAYLFYGGAGVGKRTLALDFAAAVLCGGAPSGGLPCGECPSCRKILSGVHPDLWIYEGKGGANSIHIETVRALRQDAYVRPNESAYKVYLLPRAEDMSVSAANAFLKVLEEPPAHAVFLLTADNRERLPETVRSRCIQLEVFPFSTEEVRRVLDERYPRKTEDERAAAAAFSDGVIGRAVDFLEREELREVGGLAERSLAGLVSGSEYELLAGLSGASQSKERLSALLEQLSARLRAALLCRYRGRPLADPLAEALSARFTPGQLERLSALLEEARAGIDGNANLGLLANWLSAGWMRAAMAV